MKKTPGDIILYVYQKLWSDDVHFVRHGARPDRQMEKVTYRGGCPT